MNLGWCNGSVVKEYWEYWGHPHDNLQLSVTPVLENLKPNGKTLMHIKTKWNNEFIFPSLEFCITVNYSTFQKHSLAWGRKGTMEGTNLKILRIGFIWVNAVLRTGKVLLETQLKTLYFHCKPPFFTQQAAKLISF